MKTNNLLKLMSIACLLGAVSCGGTNSSDRKDAIEADSFLTEAEIEAGILTPEVMWKLGRVSQSEIAPDGSCVAYMVTRYNMAENKGVGVMYLTDTGSMRTFALTDGSTHDGSPQWNGDGTVLYFLSDRSGDNQVWKMEVILSKMMREGSAPDPVQVTDIEGGIEGFQVALPQNNILYTKKVKIDSHRSSEIYGKLDKSRAMIYDDLMVRHYDHWSDGEFMHIFVAPLKGETVTSGTDIMPGERWDSPISPGFDMSEIAWNGDGTRLAYSARKLSGKEYAVSTDSDIYLYDLADGSTDNLTLGMQGYDRYPRFSPDGTRLAFSSMATPGFESDVERLMVVDLKSRQMENLTADFDYGVENVEWDDNGHLFFISAIKGVKKICYTSLSDEESGIATSLWGDYDINRFTLRGGSMIAEITSLSMPTELYKVDPYSGVNSQFTTVNTDMLSHLTLGRVEPREIPTTDKQSMLAYVVYPPDFDPAKKYPVLLYCQGGPQNTISQFWSYRWNFQLMAAQGYVVVAPNRRGTPSFGSQWLKQISGDYSGQNIRDYLSAIDLIAKEPWADKERLGCVGASYGGYSVFYLAGCHQNRFKAFIAHCGMFNLESWYGSTEELWFANHDLGGSWWSDDPTAKRSYANSPHRLVKNWNTPMLIITCQQDFRIPYTQSLQAFTAAQLQGVPSRLVCFEDEGHTILKPQNSLAWNNEFFAWLDKYVKNPEK